MTDDRPRSDTHDRSVDETTVGDEPRATTPDSSADSDSDRGSTDNRRSGSDHHPTDATRAPNTLLNALVGAAVTVITAFFVPLSPLLGGAIAGYLEGADTGGGLKVGTLSGVIALIPLLVIVPFVLFVFVLEPIAAFSILLILTIGVAFLAVYTVGFGAIGGLVGAYLYEEFGTNG